MIPFAPHTLQIRSFRQGKSGRGVATNAEYSDGGAMRGCVTAKDPDQVFAATRVQYKRPHRLMLDLADAARIKEQDQLVWDGRTFTVVAPIRISKHGLPTDHASAMMEELTAPSANP